jgi:antitoxin (DNA-binding transcriptional repressor) of toxin-antitoxin stability system
LTGFLDIRNIRNMRTTRKSGRPGAGSRVSATEAAKNFGRLVDRVREERAVYTIERGGKAVAQITPVEREAFTLAELKTLLASLPGADEAYLHAVEGATTARNRPRTRRNPWAR